MNAWRKRLISEHPLLAKIAQGSRWLGKDKFPSEELWADEVEKWLQYVEGRSQFGRFLSRLSDLPAKRDETLAEIKAAYFIEKYAGYPIDNWEPPGTNGKLGEFSFGFDGKQIFCEVKSPGWERAIVESEGANSPRKNQPKYIPGVEAGLFDNSRYVRGSISKAYPKFAGGMPNLLILADDLRVSLTDDPLGVPKALYEPGSGCFTSGQFSNLGAVAVLNVEHTGSVEYSFCVYHNPMAIESVIVPKEVFTKYKQVSD